MKTPEEKIQFKNHFFKLGQGRVMRPDDERFWLHFWRAPKHANDIFELLTPYDVQTVRDQNLPNVLLLVERLIFNISRSCDSTARKRSPDELLNCIRLLTKILPFLFELPNYHTEIEPRFFLARRFNPVDFVAGASAKVPGVTAATADAPNADAAALNADDMAPNSDTTPTFAAALVFSLVSLLFADNFTVDPKASRTEGSHLCLWEPGIGRTGSYLPPDAIYDTHRNDILRLLLVLISTRFYDRVPNVAVRGSVFLTILVAATPNHHMISLVCSLVNLICRTGKSETAQSGLDQAHVCLVQLRLTCLVLALQLLASMVSYIMPGQEYTAFLGNTNGDETKSVKSVRSVNPVENENKSTQNAMKAGEGSPISGPISGNRVMRFLALLTDKEIAFLSSRALAILRRPMESGNALENHKPLRHAPSPMFLGTLVLLWELSRCNSVFRRAMAGKYLVALAPCVLYHVFAFYDVAQHAHSVKVATRFLFTLASLESLVRALIVPMHAQKLSPKLGHKLPQKLSQMDLFPPEFRVSGPVTVRDFLVVHMCQIIIAITAGGIRKTVGPEADTQTVVVETLVECLYNMVPQTNPAFGTVNPEFGVGHQAAPGLAGFNPAGGLLYLASKAMAQVIALFSTEAFLSQAPAHTDWLALLLRAMCSAATKNPAASRMLLLSFLEDEAMYDGVWNTIQGLLDRYFSSKTSVLVTGRQKRGSTGSGFFSSNPVSPKSLKSPGSFKPEDGSNKATELSEPEESSGSDESCDSDSESNPNFLGNEPDSSESALRAIELLEQLEIHDSLTPERPAGMSKKAREKLPRKTPLRVSWGGNEALTGILVVIIPALKAKLGGSWSRTQNWNRNQATCHDLYKVAQQIERANVAADVALLRLLLHYDFFPETPVAVLKVRWNHVSLGWYMLMLARDIYLASDTIRTYMGDNRTFVGNLSSSIAVFGKLASSWSGFASHKPAPHRQDAAVTDYVDNSLCAVNVWAQTSIKLFKVARPDEERGLQAFGMRFSSVSLASGVNDITSSLVKRFGPRASVSSVGSGSSGHVPEEEMGTWPRLPKRDSVSSLHSLNTLNRARSNTPRNSVST